MPDPREEARQRERDGKIRDLRLWLMREIHDAEDHETLVAMDGGICSTERRRAFAEVLQRLP